MKPKIDTKEVMRLWKQGKTVPEIAKALGKFPASVTNCLRNNGVAETVRKLTRTVRERVIDAMDSGKTLPQAAAEAGTTLNYAADQWRLERRNRNAA